MNNTLLRLGAKLFVVCIIIACGMMVFNMLSASTNKYYQQREENYRGLGF